MDRICADVREIDGRIGEIRSPSNILLLAPPFSDAERLAYALVRPAEADYTVVISTDEDAPSVCTAFGEDDGRVWVLDCITKSVVPGATDTELVKYVGSPADLTGIGIKFTKILDSVQRAGDAGDAAPGQVRVCVNSLSSFLIYTKLEAIYRFFHIFSARIRRMNGIGVYLLNPESVDEKTVSTLKQLMTGIIEVEACDGDPGVHALRYQDLSGRVSPQVRYHFEGDDLVVEP
ncbi:MAG: hypothetical protein PHP59_01115 [Methanofollis sp.]|uniref:DUF7504 family protein n=1 Tax=Methanofollis sp. TaxID=2052835 RepID=UPI0026285A8A|nr:hypothetical protein [Methanofollis sp.]MDD4253960.1 hypothetical protein [Methanofollis sp.]